MCTYWPHVQAANALSKQKVDDDALDSVEDFQEALLSELKLAGPGVSHHFICGTTCHSLWIQNPSPSWFRQRLPLSQAAACIGLDDGP